jgi:hypothetical protein
MSVTYAKMQNVTDARLLGRAAGSAGDPQEISTGTGLILASGALGIDQRNLQVANSANQATFANVQTNITGLSFSMGPTDVWAFQVYISCTMVLATGVKFYLTVPGSVTGEIHRQGNVATLATWQSLYLNAVTVPGTFFITGAITGMYIMQGTVRGAGTGGTVQVVGITGGATTTCAVQKGSFLTADRVSPVIPP